MQKHVNLVDLVKSFPTNIFLQNLASIQKRTSPTKFAHLAEKSENGLQISCKCMALHHAPTSGSLSAARSVFRNFEIFRSDFEAVIFGHIPLLHYENC